MRRKFKIVTGNLVHFYSLLRLFSAASGDRRKKRKQSKKSSLLGTRPSREFFRLFRSKQVSMKCDVLAKTRFFAASRGKSPLSFFVAKRATTTAQPTDGPTLFNLRREVIFTGFSSSNLLHHLMHSFNPIIRIRPRRLGLKKQKHPLPFF